MNYMMQSLRDSPYHTTIYYGNSPGFIKNILYSPESEQKHWELCEEMREEWTTQQATR